MNSGLSHTLSPLYIAFGGISATNSNTHTRRHMTAPSQTELSDSAINATKYKSQTSCEASVHTGPGTVRSDRISPAELWSCGAAKTQQGQEAVWAEL